MSERIDCAELEVIGSTVVPEGDDLPRRLSPIYRRHGVESVYYIPLDEESADSQQLAPEDPRQILAFAADGRAVLFETPLPARPDHWLLQLAPGSAPEYLPSDEVPVRLRRAYHDAMARASRALDAARREDAEAAAWYARRADSDDPLALMVLIGLLRRSITPEELEFLLKDLKEYTSSAIEAARRRVRQRPEYASLSQLLTDSEHQKQNTVRHRIMQYKRERQGVPADRPSTRRPFFGDPRSPCFP